MAVSQSHNILWSTGILFVILPHISLGLLSDYKICGDSECESPMSRVQAIRDYQGKDCRFLSFRKGDNIFVYHKLTGKREDLWAGTIDRQFGYFPKEAVKEEQVHATVEKVVETQESDFFCMDEFGYIIDSSHLDSDDDDYDDKIQNQESETTQTTTYTEDTSAESPSTSEDVSTEPPVSVQETDGTSTEEDESENAEDAAPGTQKEAQEAPAAPGEQGGSASSPWLSSSVTGWLGLTTEEEPGNSAEGETKDERTETQAEASFTSSVTGWLGLGGEGKPDDTVKNTEEDKESADSFTSTMTGWLGLGGENKKDHSTEKKQNEEREAVEEQEPAETFRSRRMSLDLEGSQLHEEEKEEMGTLDWLGNGLSNTLGFGLTNQESGHEGATEREAEETVQKEEEQPGSGSWFDVGIGDILGFRKDKSEADERTGSGLKETEELPVDTSQSQPSLTEEERTQTSNASKVEDTPIEHNVQSEIEIVSDTNNNDGGSSDSSKDSVSSKDAASQVNQNDIDLLEEKSQAVGGMSSMLDSEEEEEDNVSDDIEKEENILDRERSAEMEGRDHQMPKSVENEDDSNREPGKDEGDTDEDFLTQSDINLGPNSARSVDLNVDSTGRSVGEEEKTEDTVEERSDIPNQIDNAEESTDNSAKTGPRSDDHEGEGSDAETDVLQREISPIHADGSAEQSQVSGGAEERHEPVSTEEDTLTAHREEANKDLSDSPTITGNHTDAETHQGELGQEEQGHPVEDSSQGFGSSSSKSTAIVSENASEEDRRTFSASESATEFEDDADQNSVSPDMQQSEGDAHMLKETEKASEDNLLTVQTETTGLEEYVLHESGLKSGTGSETETDEEGEEKQDEVEELQEEEKKQEIKEIREEGKQKEIEDLKEEKQGEVKEEDHQNKVGEVKDEEKQGEEEELKKEDEMEEIKEERKQEEGKELQGEKKQEEVEELQQTEELMEENHKLKELKEEERREELKVVEEEKEKETKEEEKQVESSHFKVEMENTDKAESESNQKGTQGENSLESVLSETSTQTEKRETEYPQVEEEDSEEENKKQEEVEEVKDDMKEGEDERRDTGEEGSLKCENELCPHASEDGLVRDGDENNFENIVSSVEEAEIVTGKQNPINDNDQILADRTGVSQAVPSEGMEKDEDRIQDEEEKRNEDAEADKGEKEQGEEKNSDSDITENEDIKSNNANSISDLNGKIDYTDIDLLPSGESGQISLSKHNLLGKTAENKEDDQLSSSEAKNTNFSNDKVLHQGDETKPEDTETSNNGISTEKKNDHLHSDHKLDIEKDTDKEERDINVKHDDVRVNEDAQHPTGSSLLSDSHNKGTAETKSGGALGLFKNAFSFFGQKPSTESTESEPSLDSVETSGAHTSLTPEQEMDSTTDSTQVYVEDLHTNSTITLSQQQQQPTPPPVIQTSFPPTTQTDSHPSSPPPTTESPLQTKTLSKHYKNLLTHMSVDEMTVLMELFGRHKLQFLDYMLGRTDTMTDDPDGDESIVVDIERLLHYHRETLVAPSMRLADAPQEDKKKTRALIALQKLEMLLGRVRETFNKGKLDVSKTNHQDTDETIKGGSNKMSGSSVGLDNITPRDEQMGMDEEKVGHLNGGIGKEWVTEDMKRGEMENRGEEERVSPESRPHVQPQPLEGPGVMNQILDFVHQIAEDSTTHVHAVRELTVWMTVQVGSKQLKIHMTTLKTT